LREFCHDRADLALVPQLTKKSGRAEDYINGTVVVTVYNSNRRRPKRIWAVSRRIYSSSRTFAAGFS
jgi:hypothetical protein